MGQIQSSGSSSNGVFGEMSWLGLLLTGHMSNRKLYDKPPRKPTVLIVGVRQNGTISINVAGFKLSLFPISFMIYF